jgi:hypothetical protein
MPKIHYSRVIKEDPQELKRMDEGRSQEDIAEELENKSGEEMLQEGADPEDSERYQRTGDYEVQAAGLMRYISQQRESAES